MKKEDLLLKAIDKRKEFQKKLEENEYFIVKYDFENI